MQDPSAPVVIVKENGKTAKRRAAKEFVAAQYQLHAPLVYRKCLMMGGGNVAWAQDMMHNVFVRLLEHCDEVDEEQNIAGWLVTVTYRLCLDRLKHERTVWHRVKNALLQMAALRAPVATNMAAVRDELRVAHAQLEQLLPLEKAVLVMKHVDGMAQNNIAAALDISEGYVSRLLRNATEKMRAAAGGDAHG